MDPELVRVDAVPQDVRRKVLDYVVNVKGVKPSDLGYDASYLFKVRRGLVQVSDELFKALLKHIDVDEYARLVGSAPPLVEATPDDVIRVVKKALVDRSFRDFLFSMLRQAFGEEFREYRASWTVTERDIEEFVRAKRLKGLSEKTIRDEVRYIRLALSELGWTLTPDGIREYLAGLKEEGEDYILKHTAYSLKSFLKTVLKPRDSALFRALYDAFTVYRPKASNRISLPSLKQLQAIWHQLPSIESKFYFALLAETGLRPGEPFLLTINDLDLEHGMLRVGKVTATKRAFIAFLRLEFLRWVREVYLPHRDAWVEKMSKAWLASNLFSQDVIENAKQKLLPFEQSRLRREVKEVAKQVLGREFDLYELRKFFATWMVSQGVPESIVNTLQGRAPPSEFRILIEHYWSPRHEELKQWYMRHAPKVCCT
ncbi:MAG: tyrosine-type recombinase/integrase [Caldivirga sp.]